MLSLDDAMKKANYSRNQRRQIFRDLWKGHAVNSELFVKFIEKESK